jgi:O-antigen ligase
MVPHHRTFEPIDGTLRLSSLARAHLFLGVGLLGSVIFVGTRFSVEGQINSALAALVLSASVLFCVRQLSAPITGFVLLVLSAVLAPVEIAANGLSISLLLAAFLCVHWLVAAIVLKRRLPISSVPVVIAALAFAAIAVLSFLVGQYPWFPTEPAPVVAQVGGLALFIVSTGLFVTVAHQIQSERDLQRLTWVFIAAGGVLVATHFIPPSPVLERVTAVTQVRTIGSLFWVWLVALSFGQALWNTRLAPGFRVALVAIGTLTLLRGLLLGFSWASGWLPPLVALGVVLLVRFPRFTITAATILIVPVLMVSSVILASVMDHEAYSWMTRLEAWTVILRMVEANPLLGFGPANYYHYTVLFPILGWWVSFNSHNTYLDLLAQVGVLGLSAFLWFVYEIGRLTFRLWTRVPPGFSRGYAAGTLGGLAGSLVAGLLGDWIVPFAYNVGLKGFRSSLLFWLFLGGSLALYRMTARPSRPRGHAFPLATAKFAVPSG